MPSPFSNAHLDHHHHLNPKSHPQVMEWTNKRQQVDDQESQQVQKLLRTFETLPPEEQNRFLTRLVDKCSTKQLSFISNIIMPRLKMDIIRHLPREISLHILSHLPVKSLCRLAQTCTQHWYLVNDGHLWKCLIAKYEFDLGDPSRPLLQDRSLGGVIGGLACTSRSPNDVEMSVGCPSPPMGSPLKAETSSSFSEGSLAPTSNSSSSTHLHHNHRVDICHKHRFQMEYLLRSNWRSGRCNHFTIRGPKSAIVTCLQFDDKILAIATDNSSYGLIEIFHSKFGNRIRKLVGHEGGVWALEFNGNTLVSGGCDRDLRVWDIEAGRCVHRLRGHTSTVRCLKMLGGELVVTGSRDNTVRLWDINVGCCLHVFEGHTDSVRCLSHFGDIVVSGSYDSTVRVWDIKRMKLVHVLQQHHAQIYSVAFNGRVICSGSLDADVRIWDARTGKCIWTLEGHDALVGHMQLRGSILATAGSDGRVCIWNAETGELKIRMQAHINSVTSLQFDEQRIITGGDDGLKVWDFKTGSLIRAFSQDVSGVWKLQFSKSQLIAATQRLEDSFIEIMDFTPEASA
eukprot:Partr_v1_DN28438_c1_g2_i1_m41946 putative F-box and WD repeat domain containing 7, E3 ubiquitin protein ligase